MLGREKPVSPSQTASFVTFSLSPESSIICLIFMGFFKGTKVFVILNSMLCYSYNKPGHLDLDLRDKKKILFDEFRLTGRKKKNILDFFGAQNSPKIPINTSVLLRLD